MTDSNRGSFGSKIGLILATAGGAVGLGNVWRFPYMAGQEGGAAFILVYIGSVLLLGIPCMISEFIIGRHGASNTARAYTKLSNGTAWKWVGYLEVRAIMRWFRAGVCSMSMPASWANCMVTLPLWRITSRSFLLILCVRLCGR